jgi:Tol biopolymer transport system component
VFDGSGPLYVGASDGAAPHALEATQRANSPAWSPNGRFITYRQEYPGNDELMRIDVATGRVRRLTRTVGSNELTPAWSPDGRKIAYTADRGSGSSIWMMNADGSGAHGLTTAGDGVGFPAWTSDGGAVVYERHGALWIARADGANDRLLVKDAHFPSISRGNPGAEPSAITIRIRRSRGRESLIIAGSLASGEQRIGNARVQLRCSWTSRIIGKRTTGAGRFRVSVPLTRRNRKGIVTAFFAGDSSTLASVVLARSRLAARP